MRALILAAGMGKRMGRLSEGQHKALLSVGGRPIIGRIIDGISANGIDEVYIVTGYRSTEIVDYVTGEFPQLKFTFINNPLYPSTNNIYSLALALDQVDCSQGLLLLECDLICAPSALERLVRSKHRNAALVDRYRLGLDGTVVSISESQLITQVIPPALQGSTFDFSDKYKTLNIYKFSEDFCCGLLRQLVSYYARAIDNTCYYELVLAILIYIQRVEIHAEVLCGELWAEVDDPNDLRNAEFLFTPKRRREFLESSWGGYWSLGITDFAFIRNMYFPTPSMLSQLRGHLPELVSGYGSSQELLDLKLADVLGCKAEHVHVLNGASQFYPVLQTWFRPDDVLLPAPTFGEYRRIFPSARKYADLGSIDMAELEAKAANVELVVVVNPNNPTGTTLHTDSIRSLASRLHDQVVLVDESFIEFSGEESLIASERSDQANILVVKSLSKSLGIPGLRLGCVFSTNPVLLSRLSTVLPVWNINSIAEQFMELVLKYPRDLESSIARTIADRTQFAQRLGNLNIVDQIYPSGGNFLLVAFARVNADRVRQIADELLEEDDVFVKDVTAKFDDDRVYWRLAVRTSVENEKLCQALRRRSAAR